MIRLGDIGMPCFHPIGAWKGRTVGESGKRPIVFKASEAFLDMPVQLPCGRCVGCRLERTREWAIRLMHEKSLHDESCFITLTYDDDHLPPQGSLVKSDFQNFMKRLRKQYGDKRIRFYHCGEYGDLTDRPHYHACLFGIDFDDRYHWATRSGNKVFRSPGLERAWDLGSSEIGSLTYESASYVARYVTKKVAGAQAEAHYRRVDGDGVEYQLEPEYATMSRRPGIGAGWLEKYGEETFRHDSVVVGGREMLPPRYYEVKYAEVDPELVRCNKAKRQLFRKVDDETPERLAVREVCATARVNLNRGL